MLSKHISALIESGFTFIQGLKFPSSIFLSLKCHLIFVPLVCHMSVTMQKARDTGTCFSDTPASLAKHLLLPYQVCELDIIFNFEKAYFILDEFIIGGEIQETSKKSAVKAIEDSDMLQEVSTVSHAVVKDGGGDGGGGGGGGSGGDTGGVGGGDGGKYKPTLIKCLLCAGFSF